MTLDILIAHYHEPEEMVKCLLDSLAKQDLKNITIYIYNDGEDIILSKEFLAQYKFKINYKICEHAGTAKLRNRMIRETNSEYFWFMDSDDYLLDNACAKVKDALIKTEPDILALGCLWEHKNYTSYYCPSFRDYSIVGLNVFNRKFYIKNNLWCDETCKLAGDILLETLPKWYTDNKVRLLEKIYNYCYNPKSTVHSSTKTDGWAVEKFNVICHCIERLLSEQKFLPAYVEYKNYIMLYNCYGMLNKYKDTFEQLGLFDMNYKMDLRNEF